MEDTDNYKDTPTKICPTCEGRCKQKIYSTEGLLPAIIPCTTCEGTGEVYMTADEIVFEEECRRDDARDNS